MPKMMKKMNKMMMMKKMMMKKGSTGSPFKRSMKEAITERPVAQG